MMKTDRWQIFSWLVLLFVLDLAVSLGLRRQSATKVGLRADL
jgi:hypothetical protein